MTVGKDLDAVTGYAWRARR